MTAETPLIEQRKNPVVLVDLEERENVSPGHAGDTGLVSPAKSGSRFSRFTDGSEGKSTTSETSKQSKSTTLELLKKVGTDDDPYLDGGPWAYSKDLGGRCFWITCNEQLDGHTLLDEATITKALKRKGFKQWHWIKHDKDVYTEAEVKKIPGAKLGDPKAPHFHVAIRTKSYTSVATVSGAFGVQPSQVEVKPPSSFLDLVEYHTHEHDNQAGKYPYPDEECHATPGWNWRVDLDDHKEARIERGQGKAEKRLLDKLMVKVMHGDLTLQQVREEHPVEYGRNLTKFQKWRADFLRHCESPEQVINFYICGPGGVGKDLLAKALARALAPELKIPYFKLGGENVSFEGYDGQPVVIWEDMRVPDMIRVAKSRGMLFRILGPYRSPEEAPIVNIKNSSTQLVNRVNIVTGPTEYEDFLKGLAGEYESYQNGQRVRHTAENVAQGFRRFPLVIPVNEGEFSIFVNEGFLKGTREYETYEKHLHFRQNLEALHRRLSSMEDEAEKQRLRELVEGKTVDPVMRQYERLLPEAASTSSEAILEEFADAGQPIPSEVIREREPKADPEAERQARILMEQRAQERQLYEAKLQAAMDEAAGEFNAAKQWALKSLRVAADYDLNKLKKVAYFESQFELDRREFERQWGRPNFDPKAYAREAVEKRLIQLLHDFK